MPKLNMPTPEEIAAQISAILQRNEGEEGFPVMTVTVLPLDRMPHLEARLKLAQLLDQEGFKPIEMRGYGLDVDEGLLAP